MSFFLFILYESGSRQLIGEFDNLADACGKAFRIADAAGEQQLFNAYGRPVKVNIYMGDRLEVSVRVVAGGLAARKDASTRRST